MKLSSALSLLALAVVPAVSSATSAFVIDFNAGLGTNAFVADTYAVQGVSFNDNVLFLENDAAGTYFTDANRGTGIAYVSTDAPAYMNVAAAVDYKLTFDYTTLLDVTISAYSGLNGTGTLLGSYTLTANTIDAANDQWTTATFNFAGQAKSFDLRGLAAAGSYAAIDNVTAVPEPTSLALLGAALGVVGFAARRRQA